MNNIERYEYENTIGKGRDGLNLPVEDITGKRRMIIKDCVGYGKDRVL